MHSFAVTNPIQLPPKGETKKNSQVPVEGFGHGHNADSDGDSKPSDAADLDSDSSRSADSVTLNTLVNAVPRDRSAGLIDDTTRRAEAYTSPTFVSPSGGSRLA